MLLVQEFIGSIPIMSAKRAAAISVLNNMLHEFGTQATIQWDDYWFNPV